MIVELPIYYNGSSPFERRIAREQYTEEQGGMCYHCKCSLSEDPPQDIKDLGIDWNQFPPGFTRYPIHLHHDHESGLTIGSVHALCNAVLWQYYGE